MMGGVKTLALRLQQNPTFVCLFLVGGPRSRIHVIRANPNAGKHCIWHFVDWVVACNGRALDRLAKQKHRPNHGPMGKRCPKNVQKLCSRSLWTIFGHIADICRHFSDILSTFPFSGLSKDLPVTSCGHYGGSTTSARPPLQKSLICGPMPLSEHSCMAADLW